jgi:hypothetical protein
MLLPVNNFLRNFFTMLFTVIFSLPSGLQHHEAKMPSCTSMIAPVGKKDVAPAGGAMTTGKDILRRDTALFQLGSVDQGQIQHPSVFSRDGLDKGLISSYGITTQRLADGGINLVAAGTDCRTDRCQDVTGLR